MKLRIPQQKTRLKILVETQLSLTLKIDNPRIFVVTVFSGTFSLKKAYNDQRSEHIIIFIRSQI